MLQDVGWPVQLCRLYRLSCHLECTAVSCMNGVEWQLYIGLLLVLSIFCMSIFVLLLPILINSILDQHYHLQGRHVPDLECFIFVYWDSIGA